MSIPFDNSYARLSEAFYRHCAPTPVAAPELLIFNTALARELGIPEDLDEATLGQWFSGNAVPDGAEPLAMAYAGHQFGNFVPQLGDGRALLLGEVIDSHGTRRDIQLKGAGRTPFSRGGDGRAPLGPVLREYLVSEAMYALGVPSTRALAAVLSGEPVMREYPEPGAVLTRVASSHIRIGSFEFLAARGDRDNLHKLVDYVIQRHYPQAADSANPALALLDAVIQAQANLVAHWMSVGFVHGVMNTDNMTVCGETIDYGPCAFLDTYHPQTVFSSIDTGGRYAYRMQPAVAQWNLARLAECLLALIDDDEQRAVQAATPLIHEFVPRYQAAWLTRFAAKIGIASPTPDDQQLVEDLLALMERDGVDFTLLFRTLADAIENSALASHFFSDTDAWQNWAVRWHARLAEQSIASAALRSSMRSVNPAVIPRNHRVEEALRLAREEQDVSLFRALHARLSAPFDDCEGESLLPPPASGEQVCRTFCGT